MKNLGKIAGFNLLFIVVYAVLLRLIMDYFAVMLFSMVLVFMQMVFNFVMCFSVKDKEVGRAYLLTALLVLIVGFGVCVAPFSMNTHH
jgi:hypothetical protein